MRNGAPGDLALGAAEPEPLEDGQADQQSRLFEGGRT